jgi:predicted N-acetyltransferase YhbS
VSSPPPLPYRVERLADTHDRVSFVSGEQELDRYFHHVISQDAKRKVTAPFVMVDETGTVIGYYTLSGYSIRCGELPPDVQKKLPKYPVLPATLLGRLAIRHDRQGQKLGQVLLMDALHRSWRNTAEMGSVAIVVDALNESAKTFYAHHEFRLLEGHPNKLFLPMATVKKIFE